MAIGLVGGLESTKGWGRGEMHPLIIRGKTENYFLKCLDGWGLVMCSAGTLLDEADLSTIRKFLTFLVAAGPSQRGIMRRLWREAAPAPRIAHVKKVAAEPAKITPPRHSRCLPSGYG